MLNNGESFYIRNVSESEILWRFACREAPAADEYCSTNL